MPKYLGRTIKRAKERGWTNTISEQHAQAIRSRMVELRCDGIMARLRGDTDEAEYCRAAADFMNEKLYQS